MRPRLCLTIVTLHLLTLAQSHPPITLTEQVKTYLESLPQNPRFNYHVNGTILPIGSFHPHSTTDPALADKRRAIRDAVKHAWDAYAASSWGYDELRPVTRQGHNTFAEGLGTTIVDSLSTLYLMGGLDGRYEAARDWVKSSLDFSKVGRVIVFETVIRILGGLVSMFHLSGDHMYLRKAEELGARLATAFDTPLGLPWPRCYLNETGRCESHTHLGDSLYLAEVGTVQLEYRALAHHSTAPLMKEMRGVTERILEHLQNAGSTVVRLGGVHRALFPFALSLHSGKWNTNLVTLGAPADSYFEYLVKLWVQGGRKEHVYWQRFADVMDATLDIGCYTSRDGVTIVRNIVPSSDGNVQFQHKMDHFACYIPGMIVLGIDGLGEHEEERRKKWEWLAEELAETCFKMYSKSPSGLSGEYLRLGSKDELRTNGGYHLRPEAVEAFFYMYRYTGKEKYREYAWQVFEQIERHCRLESGGYSALKNARARHPHREDVMHSFLISETLKYLYLIFGDDKDEMALDKWVFNTEAHPFLITPGMNSRKKRDGDAPENRVHDEL